LRLSTTAEGLRRLPSVLNETRQQLVILCHGENDILRGMDLNQAARNLRLMIQVIRERGTAGKDPKGE